MKEQNENGRERKSTATLRKASRRGTRTQKMMSFRIDEEAARVLEGVPNKGRFINDLILQHYGLKAKGGD